MFSQKEDITFAPTVANTEKIICVGLNNINHARETKMEESASPIFLNKFNNAKAKVGEKASLQNKGLYFYIRASRRKVLSSSNDVLKVMKKSN